MTGFCAATLPCCARSKQALAASLQNHLPGVLALLHAFCTGGHTICTRRTPCAASFPAEFCVLQSTRSGALGGVGAPMAATTALTPYAEAVRPLSWSSCTVAPAST